MQELHDATQDPYEQLKRFRATASYKQLNIAGTEWQYIACGQGKEALLYLPGAAGFGEIAFQHLMQFDPTYLVIAPTYPAGLTTIAQVVDGLIQIMNAEGISQAHLHGGSYSGMMAQCLVRKYPDRVGKLILSHTIIPRRWRGRRYTVYRKIISPAPLILIRIVLKLIKPQLLLDVKANRAFWSAYFDEAIAALTKEDCVSRLQVWIDFDRNYTFTSNDLLGWPGYVLILETDNDIRVKPKERAALKALYPQAQTYTFHGAAHSAWITRLDEYLAVMERFLQE